MAVLSALIAVLAMLAIGGVAAFGYTLNQDLTATRAHASPRTEGDLGPTKSSLDGHDRDARRHDDDAGCGQSGTIRPRRPGRRSRGPGREPGQVRRSSRTAALEELSRISDLQTDNFNRTTEGSTWEKAEVKRNKAVSDALDAYYQAYSKAFDRNLSSARAWAAKGKEAVGVIAVQAKQQLAEFALIDRSAAEIETAIDALEQQLKTTEITCKAVN